MKSVRVEIIHLLKEAQGVGKVRNTVKMQVSSERDDWGDHGLMWCSLYDEVWIALSSNSRGVNSDQEWIEARAQIASSK